jgi:uncharacterized MAPEG superfamily protein
MEQFAEYGHTIVSMAALALIGLLLGPVSAARSTGEGNAPGEVPPADYGNATYRLVRSYLNTVEITGFFIAAALAAILAGASPVWVNWLAVIFLLSRIAMLAVHLGGVGRPNMGPRSVVFTIGWACCVILAVRAILAVFA